MPFALCSVPVAPMRKEPSHKSEMVSQLLFGEGVEVLEEEDHFVRLKCTFDGYEGWCQRTQLALSESDSLPETPLFTGGFSSSIFINNSTAQIPFGCPVYQLNDSFLTIAHSKIDYAAAKENAVNSLEGFTEERLKKFAFMFLHTGYLWGGKSVFGVDCSGFVQQVFKLLNIPLMRDAYLQATQGSAVESLEKGQLGDVAFFANENDHITHVGILLSPDEIIHASGKVKIDKIDEQGIFTKEGKKTHDLHSIRRYINSEPV